MLCKNLAAIRPCLNRELVDESAVVAADFSASTLMLTCPHSFPTPPDGYIRLATEPLQPALSLQEFHRARSFLSFALTNWNIRLNSAAMDIATFIAKWVFS